MVGLTGPHGMNRMFEVFLNAGTYMCHQVYVYHRRPVLIQVVRTISVFAQPLDSIQNGCAEPREFSLPCHVANGSTALGWRP